MVTQHRVISNDLAISCPQVQLALCEMDGRGDDDQAGDWLHDMERTEYESITHIGRRREFLAARICLKQLVQQSCGAEPRDCVIHKNSQGRPFVRIAGFDDEAIGDCSLTHSGGWVAAAWTEATTTRIGIDLEPISPRAKKVKRWFCSPDDQACVTREIDEQMTIWWCLKEASSKAVGTGLGAGLSEMVCHEVTPGWYEIHSREGMEMSGCHWTFRGHILALSFQRKSTQWPLDN